MKRKEKVIFGICIIGMALHNQIFAESAEIVEESIETVTNEQTQEVISEENEAPDSSIYPEAIVEEGTNLTIACTYHPDDLNPCHISEDSVLAKLLHVTLGTFDRNGELVTDGKNEIFSTAGIEYAYDGISDIGISYQEDSNRTTYTVTLHDDVLFSDGSPVTVDDVIFSYYLYLDKSMKGQSILDDAPIVGVLEYQENSTATSEITISQEEIEYFTEYPDGYVQQAFTDWIVAQMHEQAVHAQSVYQEFGYSSAELLMKDCFSLDTSYTVQGKTMEQVETELAAQYGYNVPLFAYYAEGEYDAYSEELYTLVKDALYEEKMDAAGGQPVYNIEGIKRIDDKTVSITINGNNPDDMYQVLSVPILPLAIYGDPSLYVYDSNLFGFPRGDYNIDNERIVSPIGAGPYRFIGVLNNCFVFEANYQYYQYAPTTRYLFLYQATEAERINAIKTGIVDLAVDLQNETVRTSDLTSDVVSIYGIAQADSTYGYIGINKNKVCVSYKPDSDASIALRKAFAVVFAALRDTCYSTYFGNTVSILDYPLPFFQFGSPQTIDDGWTLAYSTDVNGDYLYSGDFYGEMETEEIYKAALVASLQYFEQAGYTIQDGMVVKAPDGAKLMYTITYPGGTTGNHPQAILAKTAKELFSVIGINLSINDVSSADVMWQLVDSGKQELWCGAFDYGKTQSLQTYFTSNGNENLWGICDSTLDQLLATMDTSLDRATRISAAHEALNTVMSQAVVIPCYQKYGYILANSDRVNTSSICINGSVYYNIWNEIGLLSSN